jgi:hypothetical protein
VRQAFGDEAVRDALEIVALAARVDRVRHLVRVGCGEDELDVCRRLFERLQQGVEGARRQHVHFVDDVDLEAALCRLVADVVDDFADVVDAGVGGAVDFEDVDGVAGGDLLAVGAGVAGCRRRAVGAIQGLGEDACRGRLADTTHAGEEEGVGDPSAADGVGQGAADVLLPDDLFERLRAPLAGEYEVAHRGLGGLAA